MVRKMRDIMLPTPICMAPGESVSAAAKAMKEHGIGTVLVLTDGRLSGLVTDRDITVRVLAENRDPLTTRIGDICSSELVVLGPDDDVEQATRPGPRARGAPHPGPAGWEAGRRRVHRRPYRVYARLIPRARYTTETYRMRPDTSLARFVCS